MRKQVLLCVLFLSFFHLVKAQPGNVDSSFGINGIVNADFGVKYNYPAGAAKKVLLQPDGSMYFIIVDSTQTRIAKRLSNGNIDSSYGQLGLSAVVDMQGTSAAQQTDGKVVVVGYNFRGDIGDANNDF